GQQPVALKVSKQNRGREKKHNEPANKNLCPPPFSSFGTRTRTERRLQTARALTRAEIVGGNPGLIGAARREAGRFQPVLGFFLRRIVDTFLWTTHVPARSGLNIRMRLALR